MTNLKTAFSAAFAILAASVFLSDNDSQPAPAYEQAPDYQAASSTGDGVTAVELAGAQVGDVVNGWTVTNVSETTTTGQGSYGSISYGTSVRGHATNAFMRRGPVRRVLSGWRARRLERISNRTGPRGKRAKCKLCNMQSRGVY